MSTFFQIKQYNETKLHYRDMNRQYYSRIYLNDNVTPLDVSLMDTDEVLNDESGFKKTILHNSKETVAIKKQIIHTSGINGKEGDWVKIEASIKVQHGIFVELFEL